jgi:hypothetical protein
MLSLQAARFAAITTPVFAVGRGRVHALLYAIRYLALQNACQY